MSAATKLETTAIKHSRTEDLQALIVGTLFIAFGVTLYKHVGLLAGGTVGLAFLGHYVSEWSFSMIYFVINLPFYVLAWYKMGREFTLKTFSAVALLTFWTAMLPQWIELGKVALPFAALMGGLIIGAGFLVLFRHKASLGGTGIVVLHLQNTRGWRAGKTQMAIDVTIVALALIVSTPTLVIYSIIGAIAMNVVLAVNHRKERYVGM